jgi:hypothetical protein
MFNLTPDQMVMGGIAGVGAMLASFHPTVQSKLSSLLGGLNPLKIFKPSDELVSIEDIDSPEEVHEILSALIGYFKKQNDVEGIKCCAKIGNHVYEHQISDAITPQPLSIVKE